MSIESISKLELRTHFISAFSAALVFPLYQVFLPLLSTTLGAGAFEVGLIGGAANIVYSFMPFVMGRYTYKRSTRHFFIIFSSVLLTLISVFYFFVSSSSLLFVARIAEGLGWALLIPSIEAGVASLGSPEANSLGTFNYIVGGASAIGPFLGAFVTGSVSIRSAFVLTTAVLIVTLLANLTPSILGRRFQIKSEQKVISSQVIMQDQGTYDSATEHPHYTKLKLFFVIPTILCACIPATLLTFFPPYATSHGISILLVGVAAFAYGGSRFFTYLVLTHRNLRRRFLKIESRNRNLLAAFALMCFSCVLFFVIDATGIVYVFTFALVGIGYSLCLTIDQAALIAEAPPGKVGTAAGIFESSNGTGGVLAPIIAGLIASFTNSLASAFIVPIAVFFVVALLLTANRQNYR